MIPFLFSTIHIASARSKRAKIKQLQNREGLDTDKLDKLWEHIQSEAEKKIIKFAMSKRKKSFKRQKRKNKIVYAADKVWRASLNDDFWFVMMSFSKMYGENIHKFITII